MSKIPTKIRLNSTDIKALQATPEGNRFYSVQGYKGLNIQVTPKGAKSFVLRYRFNGHQKILTLGMFPAMTADQASKTHATAWTQINAGIDPNAAKAEARQAAMEAKQSAVTISDLCDRYIDEHIKLVNKPSWQKESTRLIEKIIRPMLGKIQVKDLNPGDVSGLLFKLHKTATQSRLTKAVLRTMMGRAEEWGLISVGSNPVAAIKSRIQNANKKKDRHLTDQEIVAIGQELRKSEESPLTIGLFRMFMLTGCRKSELIGDDYKGIRPLEWSSVDWDDGVIRLDEHKTSGKSGTRSIYLCKSAQETLRNLPRVLGNSCVFPGKLPGRAIVNYRLLWERIKQAVQKTQEALPESQRIDISDVTVHDLRRSFASVAARLRYPELFESALLGHSAGTVTQGYARLGSDPLRDAVEDIGGRIAGLLDGTIDLEKEAEERRTIKAAKNG